MITFAEAIRITAPPHFLHAHTRRARLFEASSRMVERARATLAAARLCSFDGDFRTVTARAVRQLACANRLQEWAENHARRGEV